MLGIVPVLAIIPETGEHGAVVHIVSVYDGVFTGKITCAETVQKYGAAAVVASVYEAVEIIEIILGLDHRVIDRGVFAVYPAHHIVRLCEKRVEINRDGRSLLVFKRAVLAAVFASGGDKLTVKVVILSFRNLVFMHYAVQLVAAESKHTYKGHT